MVRGSLIVWAALLCCGCAHGRNHLAVTHERVMFPFQDRDRSYEIFVPSVPMGHRVPLVLTFHGARGTGEGQARLGHLDELASEEGFILVAPDGVDHSWNDGRSGTNAAALGIDDVGFVRALLNDLESRYPIDPTRVYAIGMSNGGMFTHRVGCDLADRIAAIAVVSAAMPQLLSEKCAPVHPMPMVAFNGTDDPLVPYPGGFITAGARGAILSARGTRERWAVLDGCTTKRSENIADDAEHGMSVKKDSIVGCHEGTEVVTYTVEGGGHTWPGGIQYLPATVIGRTTMALDASRTAWTFFQRFQRK